MASSEVKTDTDWVSVKKTLTQLTNDGIDLNVAMSALASHLRFGSIAARARYVWESEELSLDKAWKLPPELGDMYQVLPTSTWRSHDFFEADVAQWRWPVGCFHKTLCVDPIKRRMMRGVRFRKDDLAKVYPKSFGDGRRRGRRGPTPDESRRAAVWLELLDMALAQKLVNAEHPEMVEFDGKTELNQLLEQSINAGKTPPVVGKNIIGEIVRLAFPRIEAAAKLHKSD